MIDFRVVAVLQTVVAIGSFTVVPESPCPDVFRYVDEAGNYHGEARVSYRGGTDLDLRVNVSIVGLFPTIPKLTIRLLTPIDGQIRSRPHLKYRIDFPFQNVLPKITRIQFNGNVQCTGPPEPIDSKGVTILWSSATHRLFSYPTRIDVPIENPNTPLPPPLVVPTEPQPPQTVPVEKTMEKCGLVRRNALQTLVVNGAPLSEGEYPWLVAMFFRVGVSYRFHCTANLITDRHVVTAGHCVQFFSARLPENDDMLFVAGRADLTRWASGGASVRTAKRVRVHPAYRQGSGDGDAAVVELDAPLVISDSLRPVCLWGEGADLEGVVGEEGVVAGWGRNEKGAETSPRAAEVRMPIVSQVDCLKSSPVFSKVTSDLTFCAGNRDGSGPCTGDSGAGFILERAGRWYLRGLVSHSIKNIKMSDSPDCNLNEYLLFSDVAKMTSWLRSVIL